MKDNCRKSSQFILPAKKTAVKPGSYDIYPAFPMKIGSIRSGYDSLADHVRNHPVVIIDGYIGVLWHDLSTGLDLALKRLGINAAWHDVSGTMKPSPEIERMIKPFLGADDPLFGTRTDLDLADFFDPDKLRSLASFSTPGMTILYGTGAFLGGLEGVKIYLDVPKNEIQYRSRAASICNLGSTGPDDPKKMYKRFYFVDWIALNRHKERFIGHVDIFADVQRYGDITWCDGNSVRAAFNAMSVNYFRVRPWFEPGAWGGNWIRDHVSGLNGDVPNYAWSFELIVPENGLLFEDGEHLLELSFDWLMYQAAPSVLGGCHATYGNEFPIRFDFLDTFGGGNLSIQCHPQKEYMKTHFGEDFTQEETYYILDAAADATVYLGFRENINPGEFRKALEGSFENSASVEIEHFVQRHPSKKHDLFLIPPGTIHGSGINNLVLEISSTPYIFTFKLYDWVRPDLDGKPRQLNISRGMENLVFNRCGERVKKELISCPILLDEGPEWKLWHLPTHPQHLYDVHRYEFKGTITVKTEGRFHVLSLVEGTSIILETAAGMCQTFSYAETFVIPAAAGSYNLVNPSPENSKVVIAFVK
jgi:mannose-6-phosphate isomerase class I